jgi:hypothetical protein
MRHVVLTQFTVLEIDGEKWLIILSAFEYADRESKHLACEEIEKLRRRYQNVVTGLKRDDGKLGFACSSELEGKILARILPAHPWKTIRLYPPLDSPPYEPPTLR